MNKHHEVTLKLGKVLEQHFDLQAMQKDSYEEYEELMQDLKDVLIAEYNKIGYVVYHDKHEIAVLSHEQWQEMQADNKQDMERNGEQYAEPVAEQAVLGDTLQMYDDNWLFALNYHKE